MLARQVFRDVADQRQPRHWDQGIWLRKEHGQTTEQQHSSGRTVEGLEPRRMPPGRLPKAPSLTELLAQQPQSRLQGQKSVLTMAQAAKVLTAGKNCPGLWQWSSGGLIGFAYLQGLQVPLIEAKIVLCASFTLNQIYQLNLHWQIYSNSLSPSDPLWWEHFLLTEKSCGGSSSF